jgi:hypothetical protein
MAHQHRQQQQQLLLQWNQQQNAVGVEEMAEGNITDRKEQQKPMADTVIKRIVSNGGLILASASADEEDQTEVQ